MHFPSFIFHLVYVIQYVKEAEVTRKQFGLDNSAPLNIAWNTLKTVLAIQSKKDDEQHVHVNQAEGAVKEDAISVREKVEKMQVKL